MNILELYEIFLQYPCIQTDTRKLKKGDLFFALKGPNFNANAFAGTALAQGAVYAVIDDAEYNTHTNMILVEDVLETLQQLALHHRNQLDIPVIAITGSNGKTTTKELIHCVLSTTYKTYTTSGNLNNHIGVPLTLLSIKKDAEMAVIEMGANHTGEIRSYCSYALPTHGLITNVGKAHLEGFGGYEGVKKGKGELYDHLRSVEGTAFVMWDYGYLREMSRGIGSVVKYGTDDGLTKEAGAVMGEATTDEPFLNVSVPDMVIQTRLVGSYNLPNVLCAIAVGKHFKVDDELIRKAIGSYSPSNSRSQLIEKNGNRIIMDAYNANPSSMKAAIENFGGLDAERKFLVLGAMAELGTESVAEHRALLSIIGKYQWSEVVLVGGDFLKISTPFRVFSDAAEAGSWIQNLPVKNSYLLIKGSRSMQMEQILEQWL